MRLALIADTFPPLRTSGAVQLGDLAREFARQGHYLTVILPAVAMSGSWMIEREDGVEVLRLQEPRIKDIGHVSRTLAEMLMPFAMLCSLKQSPLREQRWDGVIWYSPSIFHGPLVSALSKASACKTYLIIRDIFPDWALDMGLIRRGWIYRFFAAVARYQYSLADVIGVQTRGNLKYFSEWQSETGRKLEVLQNWLGTPATQSCSIRLDQTPLAGRKVFVYAGNMGVAQGVGILLDMAMHMQSLDYVGFLFVGRGGTHKNCAKKLKRGVCQMCSSMTKSIQTKFRVCTRSVVSDL